jgi:phosphohistidine phosphatase
MTGAHHRLVLIRHAKAAEGRVDIDRGLAPRGRSDAPRIGEWLAARDWIPDLVAVSPARRATLTWQLAASAIPSPPRHVVDSRIYDNTVEDLLLAIHDTPEDVHSLALVGHNPGMHSLAADLDDGTGEQGARVALARAYPTGAVAVFDIDVPWARVDLSGGRLLGFATPRD